MDMKSKGIPVSVKSGPPPKRTLPMNLEPMEDAGQPGSDDQTESET